MIIEWLAPFLQSSSLLFLSFSGWFQNLGREAPATLSEETKQPQEAPTVDPGQQRLMEEQQRRQEAVVQKDRVSFVVVHQYYAAMCSMVSSEDFYLVFWG